MLTLTAQVIGIYATDKFTNKETGEITEAGHKVQLQFQEQLRNGSKKIVIKDFNIRKRGAIWEKLLNKTVHTIVAFYADDRGTPQMYIPENAPEPRVATGG